jgi:hypothetical protein
MRDESYARRVAAMEQDREQHRDLKAAVDAATDRHEQRLAEAALREWQDDRARATDAQIRSQVGRWRAMSRPGLRAEHRWLHAAFETAHGDIERLLVAADLDLFLAIADEAPQPPPRFPRRGPVCEQQPPPRRRR